MRVKMEAKCGMKDIQFNSGTRDENRTAGPGHAPFRRRDRGKDEYRRDHN